MPGKQSAPELHLSAVQRFQGSDPVISLSVKRTLCRVLSSWSHSWLRPLLFSKPPSRPSCLDPKLTPSDQVHSTPRSPVGLDGALCSLSCSSLLKKSEHSRWSREVSHHLCPVRKVLQQPHYRWFKLAERSRHRLTDLVGEDVDTQTNPQTLSRI